MATAATLVIYGAAYGRSDVTTKVRTMVRDNRLSVQADNSVFGDNWNSVRKTLVVVYQHLYSGSQPQVQTAAEGSTLNIDPANPPKRTSQPPAASLKILGAAYGLKDVTAKAQSLVSCNKQGLNEFRVKAENSVFGDGWKGHKKSMVVVYEAYGKIRTMVVTESDRLHFIACPPLTVLGAAYGLRTVTDQVSKCIDSGENLYGTANNKTFGDGWKGTTKSFMAVCQYGNEMPIVVATKEKVNFRVSYTSKPVFVAPSDPRALIILGATYGPADVTSKIQELVGAQGGYSLEVKASNSLFGDSWPHQRKSFTVVYRHGADTPQVSTVEENQTLIIKSTGGVPTHPPQYTGQLPCAAPHIVVPLPTVYNPTVPQQQYPPAAVGTYPTVPPPAAGTYPTVPPATGTYPTVPPPTGAYPPPGQYPPQGNPPPYRPY